MAAPRGTRPTPQDHKPKARVDKLRAEARTIADVPEDKMAEASAHLCVDVELTTAKGSAGITVRSPLDWPYEAASQLEGGDLKAWVDAAICDDDAWTPGEDDDPDDTPVASSVDRFNALRPTHLDVMKFVDRWKSAVDEAVGKLQAS